MTDREHDTDNENIALLKFLIEKLILIIALACEVIAFLIRNGNIGGSEVLASRLALAGAIIIVIYLIVNGLRGSFRRDSKEWWMLPREYREQFDDKNRKSDDDE